MFIYLDVPQRGRGTSSSLGMYVIDVLFHLLAHGAVSTTTHASGLGWLAMLDRSVPPFNNSYLTALMPTAIACTQLRPRNSKCVFDITNNQPPLS